jgi:hypothetical protein
MFTVPRLLTPGGFVREEDLDPATRKGLGRKMDFVIIGVLLLVIAMLVYQRLPFRQSRRGNGPAEKHRRPLIGRLLRTPGAVDSVCYSITVSDLKCRWEWDTIRSDPAFQKLVSPNWSPSAG